MGVIEKEREMVTEEIKLHSKASATAAVRKRSGGRGSKHKNIRLKAQNFSFRIVSGRIKVGLWI